eukprot:2433799-Rhodomonas_salina.1
MVGDSPDRPGRASCVSEPAALLPESCRGPVAVAARVAVEARACAGHRHELSISAAKGPSRWPARKRL